MPSADLEFMKYLDFEPLRILEVGVGSLELCRTRKYWLLGVECTLVEPNPLFAADVAMVAEANVRVIPAAIGPTRGIVDFYQFNNSSYLRGVASRRPAKNEKELETHKIKIRSIRTEDIDDGRFDLALIDVEASEWYVLETMRSRPRFMSLELYQPSQPVYVHFKIDEILAWLYANQYEQVAINDRDGFFVRRSPD